MMKNDPTAANRRIGPIPYFDADGNLLAGRTFTTGAGEVWVSKDGAAYVAAAADIVEASLGFYYYVASQAEINVNVFTSVLIFKTADVAASIKPIQYRQEIDQTAATIAALPTAAAIAAAVIAVVIEGTEIRLITAVLAGPATGIGTDSPSFFSRNGLILRLAGTIAAGVRPIATRVGQ